MANRTQSDLVTVILVDVLAVYGPADSIDASDDKTVKRAYVEILAWLRDDGLAYWDLNAIPFEVVRHIADIVGYRVGPSFGVPLATLADPATGLNLEDRGLKNLRRHIEKNYQGEPVRAVYF